MRQPDLTGGPQRALMACGLVMLFVLAIVAPALADRDDRGDREPVSAQDDPDAGRRPPLGKSGADESSTTTTALAADGSTSVPTTVPIAGAPSTPTTRGGPRSTVPNVVVPPPAAPPTTLPITTTTRPPGTSTTIPGKEPARPLRVMVAGDSTAGEWGLGMQPWGASEAHRMDVARAGGPGCTFYQEGSAVLRRDWVATPCPGLLDVIIASTRAEDVDALILVVGTLQLADWVGGKYPVPTALGNPGYDADYRAAFDRVLRRLGTELRVPILVATIPTPSWVNPHAPGHPDPISVNNPARAKRLNEINRSVVAGHQRARMIPMAEAVDLSNGVVDPALHPDGIHISPGAVPGVLDRGLNAEMRSAYASVIAAQPGLRRAGTTIWWP